MIGRIFSIYCDAADDADLRVDRALLPTALAEGLAGLNTSGTSSPATRARLVVDTICSMTEQETVSIYHRLTGVSLGSVSRTL
jgi:dGTP triphosphohydrolase